MRSTIGPRRTTGSTSSRATTPCSSGSTSASGSWTGSCVSGSLSSSPGSPPRPRPSSSPRVAARTGSRRTRAWPPERPRTHRPARSSRASRPAERNGSAKEAALRSNFRAAPPKPAEPLRTLARQPSKPSQKTSRRELGRLMAATNINRVILTGNLTRDPELRSLPSGTSVCSLRVAVNTRRKDQSSGEWVDKANYFDVTVWGAQGENCAQYLAKGRPVAVDGRLEWREWQDKDGNKRQSIDIIADSVQFLGSREGGENGGRFTPQSDVPADTADFAQAPVAAGGSDDDIPF